MTYNKYHNTKVEIDNIIFSSKKEGQRYHELKLLALAGEIQDLELQVPFVLLDPLPKIHRGIKYIADFVYKEKGKVIVEDVKGGFKTDVYRMKKKMFQSRYPLLVFIEV